MNTETVDARHRGRMQRKKALVDERIAHATIDRGVVVVNTGTGKGKSSSGFGMLARALGHGFRCGVVQFIKGSYATGEEAFFRCVGGDQLEYHVMGEGFTWETQDKKRDIAAAQAAWGVAARMLADPTFDFVLLDELNVALAHRYVALDAVLDALRTRPPRQHVVVTGRAARPDRRRRHRQRHARGETRVRCRHQGAEGHRVVNAQRPCPALMVAAPSSGQGKTSVTAALARWHARQGRRVAVFKAGPDFLDPMITGRAAGAPAYQLDLWMGGEADVRARLYAAAKSADLILVEGVMGLYDGEPSSADLAMKLDLPVLAVIDGSAMAQTFGAIALGLAHYRDGVNLYGVAANRIGGDYHAKLLCESLPDGVRWMGALPRDPALALPERHLGLVAAGELTDLDARLDALADAWGQRADRALPPEVAFAAAEPAPVPPRLRGVRIAIARDAAFCFLYQANLDLLSAAGATLAFFSPLAGDALPECDAVWLPGGYPELHLQKLSQRTELYAALRAHRDAGKPLLAECGGLLFALDSLADAEGHAASMAGLLHGHAALQPRLVALGLQEVALPEGALRGHTFHHARADIAATPIATAVNPNGAQSREAVYRDQCFTASFVHFYFPSNPGAAVGLFVP